MSHAIEHGRRCVRILNTEGGPDPGHPSQQLSVRIFFLSPIDEIADTLLRAAIFAAHFSAIFAGYNQANVSFPRFTWICGSSA